jgi:hypothetical protein
MTKAPARRPEGIFVIGPKLATFRAASFTDGLSTAQRQQYG